MPDDVSVPEFLAQRPPHRTFPFAVCSVTPS
ncbi:hypothetical protein HMPREF9206_1590 [Cutibacterium acnes J139]|nr:hypothetical protein HMPREF9206_1590 [Cutibacterium acnes J139]